MKIFLSYAHERLTLAERVALSLAGDGHEVFFDRKALPPGEAYDARIRQGILECDLFVFIASREALVPGSYCLSELGIAESRWPHPKSRVLPVLAEPIDLAGFPAYLTAVTVLQPRGDVAAEVSAEIARRHGPRPWWRRRAVLAGVLVLIAALAGLFWYQQLRATRQAEIGRLLQGAALASDGGDYSGAWDRLEQASKVHGRDAGLVHAREDLAMQWLRDIRVRSGEGTFTEIVERVSPVLLEATESGSAQRRGDLFAHLAWGQYLKSREGGAVGNPDVYFERAAQADPENPYANVMRGFYLVFRGKPYAEARPYFERAYASGRESAYVCGMQIHALINSSDQAVRDEAVRVADRMRRDGLAPPDAERIWSYVYYDQFNRLVSRGDAAAFLQLLPPADNRATFLWLFPDSPAMQGKGVSYLFLRGTLEEATGHREAALGTFRELEKKHARWTRPQISDLIHRAVRRLETP